MLDNRERREMAERNKYWLSYGGHERREDGLCAMEFVSFLAGEDHSDKPVCVSEMLTGFCISLNDAVPDDQRQRLRPYLARTISTRGDGLDDQRRWLCADWLIREYTPTFLELVPGLRADAETLRALPPVLAVENVERAMVDLNRAAENAAAARDAAWAAAGAAAGDAARIAAGAAAWAAAWAAAGAAAGDAARIAAGAAAWAAARAAAGAAAGAAAWPAAWAAAGDAAGDAAWAAARDAAWPAAGAAAGAAAWDAAWAAAWDALAPSMLKLQDSILSPGGLLDRMLPTVPLVLPVVEEWREVCAAR